MSDYKGRVAVITGAASGIGKGYALRCAQLGMKLALSDIDKDNLDKLEKELKGNNVEVLTSAFDVSKDEDFKKFAQKTIEKYAAVDLLFNNAGVSVPGTIWAMTAQDWKWTMDVNVLGVVNGIRHFVPFMIEQDRDSCIVNTASVAALLPAFNAPIYTASKHAVAGLTEVLNFQLQTAGAKVRAFLLCPGYVATDLHNCLEKRPQEYADDGVYKNSEDFKERHGLMAGYLANGIPVETLVDLVFQSMEDDTFYILSDKSFLPLIEKRAANMVKGRRPRSPGHYKQNK